MMTFAFSELHEMYLMPNYAPSNVRLWECPFCGYRFAFIYKDGGMERFVYKQGDPYATHYGVTGGLKIGPVDIRKVPPIGGKGD